jgi:hypothetical protein
MAFISKMAWFMQGMLASAVLIGGISFILSISSPHQGCPPNFLLDFVWTITAVFTAFNTSGLVKYNFKI